MIEPRGEKHLGCRGEPRAIVVAGGNIFVGTSADYQFNLDELFEHIDVIEAYRMGDPAPVFG